MCHLVKKVYNIMFIMITHLISYKFSMSNVLKQFFWVSSWQIGPKTPPVFIGQMTPFLRIPLNTSILFLLLPFLYKLAKVRRYFCLNIKCIRIKSCQSFNKYKRIHWSKIFLTSFSWNLIDSGVWLQTFWYIFWGTLK